MQKFSQEKTRRRTSPVMPIEPKDCFRLYQRRADIGCTHCYGDQEDHALSMLKLEKTAERTAADKLTKDIQPHTVKQLIKSSFTRQFNKHGELH